MNTTKSKFKTRTLEEVLESYLEAEKKYPVKPLSLPTELKDFNGFVYIISDGKFSKIGFSKRPYKRLKQLQTGNPLKLNIYGLLRVPPYCDLESLIRNHIIKYLYRDIPFKLASSFVRMQGEWLNCSPSSAIDCLEPYYTVMKNDPNKEHRLELRSI